MALKDVYDFIGKSGVPVKHIVVINDGPDTCHPDSPDFLPSVRYFRTGTMEWEIGNQASACSDTSYQDFLNHIAKDVYDDDGNLKPIDQIPVHVTFIQMQSKGYPMIDPAQQEVACLTGGHYTWINSNSFPLSNENRQDELVMWGGQHPLGLALESAVNKFRNSMAGVWRMAIKVNDLANQFPKSNVMMQPSIELAVDRFANDVFEDSVVSDSSGSDVIEADSNGDSGAEATDTDESDDMQVPTDSIDDSPAPPEVVEDLIEDVESDDVPSDSFESNKTCQNEYSSCECTKAPGVGLVAGSSIAISGGIFVKEPGILSEAIFLNSSKSLFAVDNKIDRRAAVRLPVGDSNNDCLDWFPLCSVAEELKSKVKDPEGIEVSVQIQARDFACLAVDFDYEYGVCRHVEMADDSPCNGGICCWGKCMAPNDNECRYDELDDACNYPLKPFETECTADGKCCKGVCVAKNTRECKTDELDQSSCTYKNKEDGTGCTGGTCTGGECIPDAT